MSSPSGRRVGRIIGALVLTAALALIPAAGAQAAPAAQLEQCANGALAAPAGCTSASAWVAANPNATQAHYLEDEVVPFRMVLTGLSSGAHTVSFQWDTLKSGQHAYDFIYSYDYTELTGDPCAGVDGCSSAGGSYAAIPADPAVPVAYMTTGMPPSGSAHDGAMAMFGGVIDSVTVPLSAGGVDQPVNVTVSFHLATAGGAVLAWGGHLAEHDDWGAGTGAVDVAGSPFHMRLLDLDGSSATGDRSIPSGAVYYPSSITTVNDATPDGPRDFAFTAGGGLLPSAFTLDDDSDPALSNTQAFTGIVSDAKPTYSVTETETPRSTLSGLDCSTTAAGTNSVDDHTIDLANRTVTIPLDEGEEISCTFHNDVLPKLDQAITFEALPGKTFGDQDFALTAAAGSGLAVSFAAAGSCTVGGASVHITGAGSCAITASQNGDPTYNAAPDVARTFSIARAGQTISFDALPDRTSGDPDFTVSATASTGLPVSFTAAGNCSVTGVTVHIASAGSCTVTASQAGDGNYDPASDVVRSFTIASLSPIASTSPPPAAAGCKVPKLVGRTLAAAKRLLKQGHCRVGRVTYAYSSKRRKGTVSSQSRRPGKVVARNTRVNLIVSRGRRG